MNLRIFTFKVVQSCALADRTAFVIKLVVRLCVDVLGLVRCHNTENIYIQEKTQDINPSLFYHYFNMSQTIFSNLLLKLDEAEFTFQGSNNAQKLRFSLWEFRCHM